MRISPLAALPRAAKLFAVAACVALASCGGDTPTKASADTYVLATVNQQALPAPYPDPLMPAGHFRVTAGTLVLQDDGTLTGNFYVGCAPSSNPGFSCQVEDPEQSFEGSYSREEGWLELGGRRYPAEFTGNGVSVRIFVPSYVGYYPEYNVRFIR
ncbi:MAG TPA: hypothetical protein VFY65_09455 [Longimicrobium sp.]|nr:hypothetical protein [Longimicrobium sp.]